MVGPYNVGGPNLIRTTHFNMTTENAKSSESFKNHDSRVYKGGYIPQNKTIYKKDGRRCRRLDAEWERLDKRQDFDLDDYNTLEDVSEALSIPMHENTIQSKLCT